jgi:hypothetical protein
LLDERADLLDSAVSGVVTAADADQFDRNTCDCGATEAVECGVGCVRCSAGLVDQRQRRAGNYIFVEAAKGAFALAQDAESDAVGGVSGVSGGVFTGWFFSGWFLSCRFFSCFG